MIRNTNYSIFTFLILFFTFSAACSGESKDQSEMKVTYIANTGFLVTSDTQKILIDALFYNPQINYCDIPSEEILFKMEKTQFPFDNVDLLLVTHRHVDHFNAISVAKHLKTNETCKLVCPHQVVQKIMDEYACLDSINHQIIDIALELYSTVVTTVNGIQLHVLRLPHIPFYIKDETSGEEYGRHKDIENLVYVINVGNRKILHVGDALLCMSEKCFETFHANVDLAFIGHYDITDKSIQILSTFLKPEHIIYMHLPVDDRQQIINSIKMKVPDGVIFEKTLEERTF
ncbi:MAG: MBL fold metallo-hydrolase [candidate division WOR-3 bacterium]|nr:MAG: MBL fold metallo-hydrolase [candidate division WOR-3 bacterium]